MWPFLADGLTSGTRVSGKGGPHLQLSSRPLPSIRVCANSTCRDLCGDHTAVSHQRPPRTGLLASPPAGGREAPWCLPMEPRRDSESSGLEAGAQHQLGSSEKLLTLCPGFSSTQRGRKSCQHVRFGGLPWPSGPERSAEDRSHWSPPSSGSARRAALRANLAREGDPASPLATSGSQ